MKNTLQEESLSELLTDNDATDIKDLIIFNDDFNTFDHVINTLIRVCSHTPEQAEQSALITHYKGKCTVKTGSTGKLQPMKNSICDAGIQAAIV